MKSQDISQVRQGLLTVKEVASYLRRHPRTIYRWVKKKKLAHYKDGHNLWIKQADVYDCLEKKRVEPLPEAYLSASTLTLAPVCRTKRLYGKTGGTGEMAKAKSKARLNFAMVRSIRGKQGTVEFVGISTTGTLRGNESNGLRAEHPQAKKPNLLSKRRFLPNPPGLRGHVGQRGGLRSQSSPESSSMTTP